MLKQIKMLGLGLTVAGSLIITGCASTDTTIEENEPIETKQEEIVEKEEVKEVEKPAVKNNNKENKKENTKVEEKTKKEVKEQVKENKTETYEDYKKLVEDYAIKDAQRVNEEYEATGVDVEDISNVINSKIHMEITGALYRKEITDEEYQQLYKLYETTFIDNIKIKVNEKVDECYKCDINFITDYKHYIEHNEIHLDENECVCGNDQIKHDKLTNEQAMIAMEDYINNCLMYDNFEIINNDKNTITYLVSGSLLAEDLNVSVDLNTRKISTTKIQQPTGLTLDEARQALAEFTLAYFGPEYYFEECGTTPQYKYAYICIGNGPEKEDVALVKINLSTGEITDGNE